MIIKNFLKTVALGVGFCSVFGINNSTAMDNNRNNHINNYRFNLKKFLKQLLEFEKTTINNGSKIDFNVDISKQLFEKYEQIKEIIQKAIDHVVNQNDITLLNDNIEYLERNKTASTHLHRERNFILKYSKYLKYKVKNESELNLNKILNIIEQAEMKDIGSFQLIVNETTENILQIIPEIKKIILKIISDDTISEGVYNVLVNNMDILKTNHILAYRNTIETILEYSNRIKIEAKKYLNHKKLKDEGWEIIEK